MASNLRSNLLFILAALLGPVIAYLARQCSPYLGSSALLAALISGSPLNMKIVDAQGAYGFSGGFGGGFGGGFSSGFSGGFGGGFSSFSFSSFSFGFSACFGSGCNFGDTGNRDSPLRIIPVALSGGIFFLAKKTFDLGQRESRNLFIVLFVTAFIGGSVGIIFASVAVLIVSVTLLILYFNRQGRLGPPLVDLGPNLRYQPPQVPVADLSGAWQTAYVLDGTECQPLEFPSGAWRGYYTHNDPLAGAGRHAIGDFQLQSDPQAVGYPPPSVSGNGCDDVGCYTIAGRFSKDTHKIAFSKTYQRGTPNQDGVVQTSNCGHTVEYRGAFVEGPFDAGVRGSWTIQMPGVNNHGEFHLWPASAEDLVDETPTAPPP